MLTEPFSRYSDLVKRASIYKIVYLTNLMRIHIVKHKETLLMMFSLRYRFGLPSLAFETGTTL